MSIEASEIRWRLRLEAAPHVVFALLATDEGRASFWAERTEQMGDRVTFHFPNGEVLESRVLESEAPRRLKLAYFNGSVVTFDLEQVASGTDLRLHEAGIPPGELSENQAGWVSILLSLKAQADHGADLRNHDPKCTWSEGYVDN